MEGYQYQALAMTTMNRDLPKVDQIMNAACGMNGEAGEVIDLIKKWQFQGHYLDEDKILDECGDVLWYVALMCEALGTCIDAVMRRNIDKLAERYPKGFDAALSINRK